MLWNGSKLKIYLDAEPIGLPVTVQNISNWRWEALTRISRLMTKLPVHGPFRVRPLTLAVPVTPEAGTLPCTSTRLPTKPPQRPSQVERPILALPPSGETRRTKSTGRTQHERSTNNWKNNCCKLLELTCIDFQGIKCLTTKHGYVEADCLSGRKESFPSKKICEENRVIAFWFGVTLVPSGNSSSQGLWPAEFIVTMHQSSLDEGLHGDIVSI